MFKLNFTRLDIFIHNMALRPDHLK